MQTSPATEQNKNIKWSESPWNQSGRKGSMEEMICRRTTSLVQCERLNE